MGTDPGALRIGFTTDAITHVSVHADCISAVKSAAQLCADLGHEVIGAAPQIDRDMVSRAFMVLWSTGCASILDGTALLTGQAPSQDQGEPLTWALYEMAHQYTASDYHISLILLQAVSRQIATFFTDYDVFLTPTTAEPPVPLGAFDSPPDNPLHGLARAAEFVPFTPICNATGQPAMSVPLFWNSDGLPVGAHFIGRFGDEATLFRLAAQLEAARPWAHRRPTVSA